MKKQIIFSFLIALMAFNFSYAQSNHAVGKKATQSSTYGNGTADKAVDDNTDGKWSSGSVTHTKKEMNPWLEIDLGGTFDISEVYIFNRTDCCQERFDNIEVYLSDSPAAKGQKILTVRYNDLVSKNYIGVGGNGKTIGRYLKIVRKSDKPVILSIAEVQVHGIQVLQYQWIKVFNEAGYVSRYTVTYDFGPEKKVLESGNLALGETHHFHLDFGAKNVVVKGEGKTGLVWEPWRTTFEKKVPDGINTCFKSYGTTLNQKWAEDCKQFDF